MGKIFCVCAMYFKTAMKWMCVLFSIGIFFSLIAMAGLGQAAASQIVMWLDGLVVNILMTVVLSMAWCCSNFSTESRALIYKAWVFVMAWNLFMVILSMIISTQERYNVMS